MQTVKKKEGQWENRQHNSPSIFLGFSYPQSIVATKYYIEFLILVCMNKKIGFHITQHFRHEWGGYWKVRGNYVSSSPTIPMGWFYTLPKHPFYSGLFVCNRKTNQHSPLNSNSYSFPLLSQSGSRKEHLILETKKEKFLAMKHESSRITKT